MLFLRTPTISFGLYATPDQGRHAHGFGNSERRGAAGTIA